MALTTPKTFIRFVGANHPTDYIRIDQWVARLQLWKKQGIEEVNFFSTGLLNSGNGRVEKYRVLEAKFSNLDIPYGKSFDMPPWSISIYSVQKQSKNKIKQLLLEQGLKEVVTWLLAKRQGTWLNKGHSITVFYNETTEELYFENT